MKGKTKNVVATLLALVVTLSVLSSYMAFPVVALSGNQEIGVLFAYGGNHGDIVLQGGWHKGASNNRFAVWYTKADRRVMYCLEPGRARSNESQASSRDVNYIRNEMSNRFLNGYQIERFIGYILGYGYTGTIDGGQDIRYIGQFSDPIVESGGSSTTQLYEACQILIWETVVGERDANFNYVAPESGYTPCKAIHTTGGEAGEVFELCYRTIADAVKNFGGIPSYMAPNMRDADLMEPMRPNSDGVYVFENNGPAFIWDWSFFVVDSNKQNIPGATVTRKNEVIEVTLPSGVTEAYLYGYNRLCGDGVVAWSSDGDWGVNSSTQDLIQRGFADPVAGYRKLGVESGSISIQKNSDYGVISGLQFNLYFRGNVGDGEPLLARGASYNATTGTDGVASFNGLPYGWYEIEEVSPMYTCLEMNCSSYDSATGNALVHVGPGENSSITVNAFNRVMTIIRVNKIDLITGEHIGNTSFNLYRDYDGDGVLSTYEEESAVLCSDEDGDGILNFENIGVGSYLLREAQTSGNYSLSSEIIPIVVTNPQLYEVTYTNDAYGSLSVTKVDEDDYEHVLTDAVFEVYRDVNENEDYDEGVDEFIAELRDPNEDGEYMLFNLVRDNYLLLEVQSPLGYELDPNVYPFEISLENLDVVVGNCSDGVFTNGDTIYGTRFMCTEDEDNRNVEYGEEITLYDNVMYENVIPGKVYELELVIMDRETGEPLLDENSEEISVSYRFVPDETSGVARVPVTINSTLISGKTIVAYEVMYRDGRQVGIHADIEDELQTLLVPSISTSATAGDGVSKVVVQSENTEFVDTVNYFNLDVDREYRIVGVIMDRSTGTVYQNASSSISEVLFTPVEGNGVVTVDFTISTVNFDGNLVVFEELYDVETGILIAVHKSIDDEGQTVAVRALPTNTPTPTTSITPTPVPGTPKTGDSSSETIKLVASGSALILTSVVVLIRYFAAFRNKEN